ncbi:hypothetical protein D3C84_1203830 [compost metagenome]
MARNRITQIEGAALKHLGTPKHQRRMIAAHDQPTTTVVHAAAVQFLFVQQSQADQCPRCR